MYRNLFTILLTLCLFVSFTQVEAGRKRGAKSGKINNNVYTDSKFDFKVSIPEGWKGKTQKEKSDCRLTIKYKKNKKGDLRTDIVGVDGFELITPTVSFWLIKTDVPCRDYLDSFLKDPIATKINEKITTSLQASWTSMNFERFRTWTYSKVSIDNHEGVNWVGILDSKYKSSDAELLYQLYAIFDCVQIDDESIMFITGKTELAHFNKVSSQVQYIMRSVVWGKKENR